MQDFVGKGVAFPLALDSQGRLGMVTGAANIERSIALIVGTAYGERPMRPEFGCGIHDLVFNSASPELRTRMQLLVTSSLERWERGPTSSGSTSSFDKTTRSQKSP